MRLTIVIANSQNIQFSLQAHPHDASKKSIEFIYCQIYTIFPKRCNYIYFCTHYNDIFQEILHTLENLRNCCNQIHFLYYSTRC